MGREDAYAVCIHNHNTRKSRATGKYFAVHSLVDQITTDVLSQNMPIVTVALSL